MKITGIAYSERIYGSRDGNAPWNNHLPWQDAINVAADVMTFQVFRILTDDNVEGLSSIYPSPLPRRLTKILIGENPLNIERVWNKLFWASQGRWMDAIGAIDVALWDLFGKVSRQPVYRLLGGYRDQVPVYGSGGGLNLSQEELVQEQLWYIQQGYTGIKLKLGLTNPDEDLERVKAVRDAVGSNIDVMTDVNNGWSVTVAIKMAKKLERFDVAWLEEPLWKMDIKGYARLTRSTDIPIATGEGMAGLHYFKRLLEHECCDIIQADPTYCGGPTAWKKIASLAEAYGVHMAPHHKPEHPVNAQLTAAVPNGLIAEEFYPGYPVPMFKFYKGRPFPRAGWITVSSEPGFGVELDFDQMSRYKTQYAVAPPQQDATSHRPCQSGVALYSTNSNWNAR